MQAEDGSGRDFGDICDAELHTRLALIVVDPKGSGDMQPRVVAGAEQRLAERRGGGAEGDGLEPRPVVGSELEAHMPAGTDDLGEFGLMRGKGEDGLRIAGAERPCPLDVLDELDGGATGAQRGVDLERGQRAGDAD